MISIDTTSVKQCRLAESSSFCPSILRPPIDSWQATATRHCMFDNALGVTFRSDRLYTGMDCNIFDPSRNYLEQKLEPCVYIYIYIDIYISQQIAARQSKQPLKCECNGKLQFQGLSSMPWAQTCLLAWGV